MTPPPPHPAKLFPWSGQSRAGRLPHTCPSGRVSTPPARSFQSETPTASGVTRRSTAGGVGDLEQSPRPRLQPRQPRPAWGPRLSLGSAGPSPTCLPASPLPTHPNRSSGSGLIQG